MSRHRRKQNAARNTAIAQAWTHVQEASKRRRKQRGDFPQVGELDENGNTPCAGCGALFPVWEDYAIFAARMQEEYPDEPIETLEETVADGDALCEECGEDF